MHTQFPDAQIQTHYTHTSTPPPYVTCRSRSSPTYYTIAMNFHIYAKFFQILMRAKQSSRGNCMRVSLIRIIVQLFSIRNEYFYFPCVFFFCYPSHACQVVVCALLVAFFYFSRSLAAVTVRFWLCYTYKSSGQRRYRSTTE